MYLIISLSASNYAQQEEYHNCTEPDASYAEDYESQTGGWLKPASNAQGEYFRALFLYIGFADDSTRYSWDWPAYQLPDYAYRIIDSIPKTTYRTMTISDYWDKMSMGNYDFIGDVYPRCIILPIAYRDSSYGICNKKVISMIKDSIDCKLYDNWGYSSGFYFSEGYADGYLDMIFMIDTT